MNWYYLLKQAAWDHSGTYGCWISPQGQIHYCDTEEHGTVASGILDDLGQPSPLNYSSDPYGSQAIVKLLGLGWARCILPWPSVQMKVRPQAVQLDTICKTFHQSGAKAIQVDIPNIPVQKYTIEQFREVCNGKDASHLQIQNNPWTNPEMFSQRAF